MFAQLPTSVRPEWLCLATLLSFDQCGLDEGICQRLNGAGIFRIDDLVTRSMESLRYWVCLTDAEVSDLQRQLGHVDLPLESLLPLWVRAHYAELQEAFEEDLEQLASLDAAVDSLGAVAGPGAPGTQGRLLERHDAGHPRGGRARNRHSRRR